MTEAVTDAEKSAEEKEKAEAAEAEATAKAAADAKHREEFDYDRAMKTIHAQRESEAKLKADLKVFTDAEEAASEAEKSAEQKATERDARIGAREEAIAFREAEVDFRAQAEEAGITDTALALLVAKEENLLGTYDPKSGTVSVDKVDFDELLESHPVLAGDGYKKPDSGDAGRIGRKPAKTVNQIANDAFRGR